MVTIIDGKANMPIPGKYCGEQSLEGETGGRRQRPDGTSSRSGAIGQRIGLGSIDSENKCGPRGPNGMRERVASRSVELFVRGFLMVVGVHPDNK